MSTKKCEIIYIRHGATLYTEQKRFYISDDYPPLNEKGKEEIKKLSEWIRNTHINIDLIYSSPALSSIQSARIIAKGLKKDFSVLDDICGRRFGIWGGLTFEQIQEKYPELYQNYKKDPLNFQHEGLEKHGEVNKRVKNTIDFLLKNNPEKKLLIITHAGVIKSAVGQALCIPEENQERICAPTGSAAKIDYFSNSTNLVFSGYMP
jgi:broad specificity phosphatase PhoE